MRCIICLATDPPTEFTEEHIFPEALGGTLTTNNVCKPCNDLLGHTVDEPLVNHTLVALIRRNLKLAGKKGKLPNPFEHATLGDDSEHKVRYAPVPGASGLQKIYTVPSLKRIDCGGGRFELQVRLDADDIGKLGSMVNKAVRRIGAPPLSDDEVERLKLSMTQSRRELPQLSIPMAFDISHYRRGLIKIVYESE